MILALLYFTTHIRVEQCFFCDGTGRVEIAPTEDNPVTGGETVSKTTVLDSDVSKTPGASVTSAECHLCHGTGVASPLIGTYELGEDACEDCLVCYEP